MAKKFIGWIVCIVLVLTAFAGCSTSAETTSDTSESTGTTLLGQITAIDGDQITLAIGTENQGGGSGNMPEASGEVPSGDGSGTMPSGEVPSGDASGSMPSGQPSGDASGTKPETSGEVPSGDASGMNGGGMGGGLTLTGEEQTITVSDSTVITIEGTDEDTTGSVSDLAVDDIISVTMSGDTVTAITVRNVGGGNMGAPSGENGEAAPSGSAAAESSENTSSSNA